MNHSDIFFYPPFEAATPSQGLAFAAIGLAHAHISGMIQGLVAAGAELKYIYDPQPALLESFAKRFPGAAVCQSEAEVLDKQDISLIASAHIPSLRAELGIRTMLAGKDFFVDKAPMITLEQVAAVRNTCHSTGKKCFIYYGESIDNASALYARQLISRGVIGKVLHVEGMAPHRLNPKTRQNWFFERACSGGILTDLICHQLHQFLEFANVNDGRIDMARVSNRNHPEYGDWDDFGDCACTASDGTTGHFRVDWFTPDGLSSWGDSRMIITGTDGFIELRKNCDIARDDRCDVYVVNQNGEYRDNVTKKVDKPFFRNLIRDCLERTDTAMDPNKAFRAIELAIEAQDIALKRGEKP